MKTSKLLFNIAYIVTVVIGVALVILVVVAGIMEIWDYDTEYVVKWMFTLLVLFVFMAFVSGVLISRTEPKKVDSISDEERAAQITDYVLKNYTIKFPRTSLEKLIELRSLTSLRVSQGHRAKIKAKLLTYGVDRVSLLNEIYYDEFRQYLLRP